VPLRATWILHQIAKLYHLEQQLRDGGAGPQLRAAHRASQAAPILARLHRVLCAWKSSGAHLPASSMGEAIDYALGQWDLPDHRRRSSRLRHLRHLRQLHRRAVKAVLGVTLTNFHHHELDIRDRQETLSMMPTDQLAQDYDTFEGGFLHGGCFKAARHGKMLVQRAGKDPCKHRPCCSVIPRSKHQ